MYAAMNMCRDGWRDVIGGGGAMLRGSEDSTGGR